MCWSCEEKKKTSLPLVLFEVEDEAVAVAVAVAELRSLEKMKQCSGYDIIYALAKIGI